MPKGRNCCCSCGPFRVNLIPPGTLKPVILSLLKERPMHGYEIMREIDRRTSGFWKPKAGAIYPVLADLEERKLIERRPISEGERVRYVYTLTDEGLESISDIEEFRKDWRQGLTILRDIF